MLSAAMIIPAAQAAFPVVYASSFDGWNTVSTNTQGSVQRTAKTVFELAAASYSGETLVPLACYGVQTVAGTNYYYICVRVLTSKRWSYTREMKVPAPYLP